MRKRLRVLADVKLQGALCIRLVIYWMVCQLSFVLTLIAFAFLSDSGSIAGQGLSPRDVIVPAIVISSLVLPIVIVDLLAFSNRFAGPYMRIRRALGELASGKKAQELVFRKRDMHKEVASNINSVIAKITSDCTEKTSGDSSNSTAPPIVITGVSDTAGNANATTTI